MKIKHVSAATATKASTPPRFRVHLVAGDNPHAAIEAFEVEGADVIEAAEWARQRAGCDRSWSLASVHDVATSSARLPEPKLDWLVTREPEPMHQQGWTGSPQPQRTDVGAGLRSSAQSEVLRLEPRPAGRGGRVVTLVLALVAILGVSYVASINLAFWITSQGVQSVDAYDRDAPVTETPCPACDGGLFLRPTSSGLLVWGLVVAVSAAVRCAQEFALGRYKSWLGWPGS